MGNGINELTGMQRTVSGYVDIVQNDRLNEANKGYNRREDEVFEKIRSDQFARDAFGKTEYEKSAEAKIKDSQEAVDRLNKQIEAEQKTNADRDRLARLQQERDEADKVLTQQEENYNRYQAQEQAKAFVNNDNNRQAYQDAVEQRQAVEQREQELQQKLKEAPDVYTYRQEMERLQEEKSAYDDTISQYEKAAYSAKQAEEYNRFEFTDRKEYEKAVAALEQQGVRVAATTAAMSNDRGDTVYVFEVNRSNSRQAQDIINDYGYEADSHGHYYDDGTYEAKRSDDHYGMGREDEDVARTKRQYENALSGYGNLIFRETGELYHMYLMASDVNDFINGAAWSVAMETALINEDGKIEFQNKEQKDAWKNPYEAIGLNTGAFDETVMRIRGNSDEFVKKLSKETGRHLYSDKELREISAASLTRADVEKLTKSSLDKLHAAGLITVLDNGNIDMAALSKLSPDVLKGAGIDHEIFKKVVMKDLHGVEQWGAFAGVKAAGASVGKGMLRFVQKADDNEGNLTQTVNEVRQGVDYFKRPVDEIEKAVKKSRQIRQSKKRIKDPNKAAGKKVDTSKVQLEKTNSAKVRKNRQSKIKASEKSIAKAKGNLKRRNKLLEKWDKSIFGRGQKKLAKVSEWFFSKTVIGKAIAAVSSTVSTIVSTILLPAIGIGIGVIFMLAFQLTAIIVITCLVNSLFDFEISPDEGVTYTLYHDILKGYEDDWLKQISDIDNIWKKIDSGKDIRFGYDYKPWTQYAQERPHLIVQDDGWDVGLLAYTNLQVYLNPFDFKPLYPKDYYVKISKNGTTDSKTGKKVGKFGDAGSMLTFYPNMTFAAKKGAGGHTSNIKDIICMMDVMFNFQKTSDAEAAEAVDMSSPIQLIGNWIESRLKYGLRLIMDIFTPTPHDPSVSLDDWSHMKAYCENLFMATHQEMLDIDVIIFDCTDPSTVSYITDTTTDIDMTDTNYRDSLLEGYLASGCPGQANGGCRQSTFYACVGGNDTDGYTGNLGIVAAAGVGGITADGQFGKVGTLTNNSSGSFDRVTIVDNISTKPYCINQSIIGEINSNNTLTSMTYRLQSFLSDQNGKCWKKIENVINTVNPEKWYHSNPPGGSGWSTTDTTIEDDVIAASLTTRAYPIRIVSKIGNDEQYNQYILIAHEKWIKTEDGTVTWKKEEDNACNCTLAAGESCKTNHGTHTVSKSTKRYRYEKGYDIYCWSVAAYSSGNDRGKMITNAAGLTLGVDASGYPSVTNPGTTCQGHEARYCGGHSFVDMKGIIFSFTDAEIAAANGKTYESPTGEKAVIIPVIDEEKLNDVIQAHGTSISWLKGGISNSIIHDARKEIYDTAGVYGLNIITNVYNRDVTATKTWATGYDSDGDGYVKGNETGAPVVNPNVHWERVGLQSDLRIGGISLKAFFSDYTYDVSRMLYVGTDIFDIDASIDYPMGFFPQTEEGYTGWTETNMYLALQRYNMSWEDTYTFDIPVNFNCPQLSETQIAEIVKGVKKHYGSLKSGEENAILAALQSVGNGQYSQMHHGHGYLLNPDIESHVNMEELAYSSGLMEQKGHPCTATDCSGLASYVITMGGDSRILSEGTDTAYQVWTTDGFYSHGAGSSPWDGTCDKLRPGDVFIHADGTWHALIYIGCLDEDLTISWVTKDGGYTFLKNDATGDYEVTSQITIKAGMPITVDCTRLDSKGNIYLRNGGIDHNWLPASSYITSNDGNVYVYRPDYPN